MKKVISKIKKIYGNMALLKKYLLTFIILVLIPVLFVSGNFIIRVNESLNESYYSKQSAIIKDAFYNFNINVKNVERIDETFQVYDTFLTYLSGYYFTPGEQVYVYNKDLYGIFSNTILNSDVIEHIKVYNLNDNYITIQPYIYHVDELSNHEELKKLNLLQGLWVTDFNENNYKLRYFSKLYTSNYSRELGFVEVIVSLERLLQSINSELYSNIIIKDSNGTPLSYDGNVIKSINQKQLDNAINEDGNNKVISPYQLSDKCSFKIVSYVDKNYPKSELIKEIILIVFLLAILYAFYEVNNRILIKRINKLKKHLSVIKEDNLIPIKNIGYMDEIGYTMMTFNQMTGRINSLINEVYKEELIIRETMYYALEAQIKPHFLYNTLESIRMIAEENCDFVVADSLYSLGHMLRYTLSKDEKVFIKDELLYVSEYLSLYKNRMKSSFTYTINNDVEDLSIQCPKHIIQPLIENAIQHGFKNIIDDYNISIDVKKYEHGIIISIKDNGLGMPDDEIEQINSQLKKESLGDVLNSSDGIGLKNVSDRLKMFYGDKSNITICKNETKGLIINIIINLEEKHFQI